MINRLSESEKNNDGIVSFDFHPVSIAPVSATVQIHATHPSTIWCEGVELGLPVSLQELDEFKYRVYVNCIMLLRMIIDSNCATHSKGFIT